MSKLKIKQTKSQNGANHAQRETLRSLRLGKINRVVEHEDTPQLRGMIHRVRHLVEIEE
ncbi:MAG: 50S ribosomal protein L30 [Actinobacteria bacterium]|nr:50S ribosomal protein L30 [Actinomycetota bacterium]